MSLTIVLPIHGRPEFVERFLGLKLPYRTHLLTEPGFLDKIARGIDKVTTPYVMLADCDDFPIPAGINDSIAFLNGHPDFVCASGRVEGVWLFPNKLTGPLRMRSRQYSIYDTVIPYAQASINERVLLGFRNSWSYYGVYRTQALQTIWKEVAQYNFTDLMVHEKFCAMRTLTLGKVYGDGRVTSLIRQYATSQVAVGRSDWRKTYNDHERRSVLAHMAKLGVDTAMLNYAWSEWYEEREQSFYGHPVRKWLGRTFPFLRKLAPLLEMR